MRTKEVSLAGFQNPLVAVGEIYVMIIFGKPVGVSGNQFSIDFYDYPEPSKEDFDL